MADFPTPNLVGLGDAVVLNPYGPLTILGMGAIYSRVNGASAVYTAANRAVYVPWEVEKPTLVTRLWVLNGATVSGNLDLGIYRGTTRLASSGSVAQAGANTIQQVDITDTWIYPDEDIRFAIAMDNVTGTVFRSTLTYILGQVAGPGQKTQATAFPLPATATFSDWTTSYHPMIGGLAIRGAAL